QAVKFSCFDPLPVTGPLGEDQYSRSRRTSLFNKVGASTEQNALRCPGIRHDAEKLGKDWGNQGETGSTADSGACGWFPMGRILRFSGVAHINLLSGAGRRPKCRTRGPASRYAGNCALSQNVMAFPGANSWFIVRPGSAPGSTITRSCLS